MSTSTATGGLFSRKPREVVTDLYVEQVEREEDHNELGAVWRSGFRPCRESSNHWIPWDDPTLVKAGVAVFRVAGVSYRSDELQRAEFSPGLEIRLVPEPSNEYDRNAVAVFDASGQFQVGYLPREVAASVAGRRGMGGVVLEETRESREGRRIGLTAALVPPGELRIHPQ